MKVSSINRNDYFGSPSYKGFTRSVNKAPVVTDTGVRLVGTLKHMNNSWLYRPNIELCLKHYNYFSQLFPGTEKVNVHIYGCSLGYDNYGWLLWLLSGHEKHPERFMPLLGKDYDKDIIKAAQDGMLPLNDDEIWTIGKVIKNGTFNEFFTFVDKTDENARLLGQLYNGYIYKPTKKLSDNVQFSVADIREDYINIEPYRSIVVATNLWPYIEKADRYELAQNLYKQLAKGSAVKIGKGFDNNCIALRDKKSTAEVLMGVGFKESAECKNIFIK